MSHYIFITIIALASLLSSSTSYAQTDFREELEVLLSDKSQDEGPLGVAVIAESHYLLVQNYGDAERSIIDQQIELRNQSYWLVAAVIFSLIESGDLELDRSISTYIKSMDVAKGNITVRQLLAQTSGLAATSPYVTDTSLNTSKALDLIDKKVPLNHPPGTVFQSGVVHQWILLRLAEQVSGKAWNSLFYERIAKPCAMSSSFFDPSINLPLPAAAISTGSDMANFIMMIMNNGDFRGNRVLSIGSVSAMLTDASGNLPRLYGGLPPSLDPEGKYYGLGVWLDAVDVQSGLAAVAGYPYSKGIYTWLDNCKNLGGVLCCNPDKQSLGSLPLEIQFMSERYVGDSCLFSLMDRSSFPGVKETSQEKEPAPRMKTAWIRFELEEGETVRLRLFDSLGNMVEEILDQQLSAGDYNIPVSMDELYDGIFFYKLTIGDETVTRKLNMP